MKTRVGKLAINSSQSEGSEGVRGDGEGVRGVGVRSEDVTGVGIGIGVGVAKEMSAEM